MFRHPNKSSGNAEKSSMSAVEIARSKLCDLAGPRGWHDTREAWLARGARKAGISIRRARALFYHEPMKLGADEYLAIERAYQSAHEAVARISTLASDADLRAGRGDGARSGEAVRKG